MIIGAKYKICKRLGANVFEKCQTQKFVLSSSNANIRRPRRAAGSDYGRQLIEKQKARFTYGLGERQFGNYVREAMAKKGVDSVGLLIERLEGRLDNVVFRAGFAATRRQARQMVTHGHITVQGRRVSIPSYRTTEGDLVTVRAGSAGSPLFAKIAEEGTEHTPPAWLSVDAKARAVRVTGVPTAPVSELLFDPKVIIQFYSR